MKLIKRACFVVGALAVGLLTVKPLVTCMMDRSAIRNGPWRTVLGAGSENANIYERAAIAVAGLYALSKEETLYYTSFTDDSGAALDAHCDYRLSGQPFAARWWSLTLYGADHYLVPNSAHVYSRHVRNLAFDADGYYSIQISASLKPVNWLPAPVDGRFSITLRLYNPSKSISEHLESTPLPKITREACR